MATVTMPTMTRLADWDWGWFRRELRARADYLIRDRRIRGRIDPSDLVQETILRAMDAAEAAEAACRATSPVERLAWLSVILNNVAVSRLRHNFAQRRDVRKELCEQRLAEIKRAFDDSACVWLANIEGRASPPDDALALKEEKAALADAIDSLPEREQQVMRLRCIDHLTIAQIADQLRITPGAAAGLIRRAEGRISKKIHREDSGEST
jgi:RNA polymerase sigma-70 factor, ECF subfamily